MSSYDDYQRRIISAQDQWNKERDRIYGETRSFDSAFQGEFDKPIINYCEIYEGLSLPVMRQKVSDMRPDEVRAASDGWRDVGWNLMAASNEFNNNFARTVNGDDAHSGWTGQAATAAVDAVNNYTKHSQNLVSAAQVVGLKLAEAHTGLEQTQALFPGITERPDVRGKTLPKDGVMKAGDYNDEEQTKEGQRILRTVYGQVVVQTDQGVPVLPVPQAIADVPPGPVDPGVSQNNWRGNGTGGTGGDNSGGGTNPGDPQNPNDGKPADGKPGDGTDQNPATQTASTSQSPTSPSGAAQGGSGAQPGGLGTGTTPAGVSGTQSGGGSGIPGYGGFGGGGLGTGGGAGRGTTAGAPSRSVPGGPAQGPTVSPAAARLGGAAAGQSGMPGMGAPGHGKGKEDEREKSGVPDYLVTKEHGDELTGLDSLPKAVPPVIGGDYDRA
ncbi:hypothetical protein [Nocardia terpenica]|uniref:PPE domain-containing protein n=1 Tax=Nocardia terpenica TaxID=455432 RepID=A0A164NRN7_9NOCA|nr:hypothetical protein [Nocardia terpenica]KZM74650.1 hypothetical protein AWN90_21505 [Nocardia terpenica]NQE93751.1 hypothetical protein [Nocardia terpenica]